MRALRQRSAVAVTTALVVLAAVAGPVHAAGAPWLTATPTTSPIPVAAGGSAKVTVTNTDRRLSSSALAVTLSPSSAPFTITSNNTCTGAILRPGASCTVEVAYLGPPPTADQKAALTVTSGKPAKASVTRVFEVGVTFADVCVARGGSAGYGGTITVIGALFTVGDRCDWESNLATAVYNAAFEALSPECFDLGYGGMVGYPVTSPTGLTAIGCVVDS